MLGGQSGRWSCGEAAPRRRQACRRSEWSGSGVLWRGSEEKAKEQAEWLSGVLVRLVRALGEGGGLCSERSTAALRWRPRAVLGGVARQGRLQREARSGGEGWERRVGVSAKQRWPAGSPRRASGAAQWRRQPALKTEQAAKLEKKMRTNLQFPKFQGLNYNLAVTFKPELK